ncbi:hypothetical protein ACQCX2_17570 [Propionibacteriaceae bacterium Y1700]|uniref:hypothetical protein n=1 Tax=Microlunatus sp. Y1700 TaxID=3418487 RepID=UPI003DA7604E
MHKIMEYAKAIAALLGAIATALLGVYAADTAVGKVLTIVAVVATVIATWAVPNAVPKSEPEPVETYEPQHADDEGLGQ